MMIVTFQCALSVDGPQCNKDQSMCGNSYSGYHAFCINLVENGKTRGSCRTDELKEVYDIESSCSSNVRVGCAATIKNDCDADSNLCGANGVCLPGIGHYFCKCKDNNRGQKCEATGDQVAKGVYFVFDPVTYTGRRSSIIFVREPNSDITIKFTAESSGEIFTVSRDQMTSTSDFLTVCEGAIDDIGQEPPLCESLNLDGELYYAKVYYYIPYNVDGPGVIFETQKPAFKPNILHLKIFKGHEPDKIEFEHAFKQTTVYKTVNECPPLVKLVNCGETPETPLPLARKSRETIKSIFEENADCFNSEKAYTWEIFTYNEIWRTENPVSIVTRKGDENELKHFTLEPFQLEVGLYLVKLTIELRVRSKEANEQSNVDYFNVCFIEIRSVSLSATIKGGDKRIVFKDADVVMNASMSYDPSRPLDQQDHLAFHWTCESHNDISCTAKSQGTSICVIETRLHVGQTYKFQLILKTTDGSNRHETVYQFIEPSKNKQVELEVVCLKNCGVEDFKTNPRDAVYMEVKVISNEDVSECPWKWHYSTNGGEESEVSSDMRKNKQDSPVLVVKENSLRPGVKYTFTVKLGDNAKSLEGSSSLSIVVNKPPGTGRCEMSPTSGTKVKTEFDISCSDFTDDNEISQLTYEFYQKAPEEPEPGTLIGYSISGEMKKFILTENTVIVRASDIYGAYSDYLTVQVPLDDWLPQIEDVRELISEAFIKAVSRDEIRAISLAGAVVDIMGSIVDKRSVMNDVLEVLNKPKPIDFSDVKLLASVLNKVVKKGAPLIKDGLGSRSIKSMGTLMTSIGRVMYKEITNLDTMKPTIESEEVDKIALSMAECSDTLVASKDETLFQSTKGSLELFKTHDNYKKGTSGMIKSLNYVGLAIVSTMLPQENERVIKSEDTKFWMKLESPNTLAKMPGIPQNSTTSVKMSENLGKSLEAMSKYIAVEVITIRNNPFWWDEIDKYVASEIASLRVWKKTPQKMNSITSIPEPVDVYLHIKEMEHEILTGVLTQPNPSDSEDKLDMSVGVHTLEAPEENSNGRLFIQVENFGDIDEFRVIIKQNLRPDNKLMVEEAKSVTANSPYLNLSYENITESTLHFVGIMPGVNVPPGKRVSYSIKIFSIQCKVRQETVWTSPACLVGEGTTLDVVHCQCSHMSLFGSSIFVAPNTVHPIKDLYLLATVPDNPLVFSLIVSLLIMYCLLLVWALLQDKKDKLKRKIIILDDNYPGDSCPYIIVVYTAFNLGSATESKVGLRLFGANNTTCSRAHILQCQHRKVLRRNADDWFLLFTPEHLGAIEAIHLWHNYSGSHPDWFCKRIKVYDMYKSEEYNFLVQQWMSAEPGEYVEVVVNVATTKETYDWKNCIIHNIIYHLRENHLWASIFMCHPRATVSKSQRLTLTFCIIMVTFLTGIMFYGVARKDRVEDEHKFEIKAREIVVVVISSFVSAITVSFVVISFKRSRVIVRTPEDKRGSTDSVMPEQSSSTESKKKTSINKGILMKYISKILHNMVQGKPLMPVLFGKETSESVIRRRRWATVGWIASQIIIWTSAFFVILYGLKLGKVTSELWATAAVVCFLKGIFFTAPMKIVLFSAILALYGEMYNVTNFECVIETAMRKKLVGNYDVLQNLIKLRSQSIYHPLSRNKFQELKLKRQQRNRTLQHVDLAVTVFFYIVLFLITGSLWEIRNFYSNEHIRQVLTDDKGPFSVGLRDVVSATKLTDYLIAKLLPSLYREKWYNGRKLTAMEESLPEMGWLTDAVHRLVGIPQFRQIRIKETPCTFSTLFNTSAAQCHPQLNMKTEDTDDYGLNWGPISEFVNKPLRAPFTYQRGLEQHPTVPGHSGTVYHSGGYVVRLEDTQKKCNAIVSDLMDNGWWDIRMRAFIAEMTLFNPSTHSHTMVSLAIEHLPAGTFTNRMTVTTVHCSQRYISIILFILPMIYFNFKLFLLVNRKGFSYVLTHLWSCYDFLFVWTSNIAVGFEVIKMIRVAIAVHVFIQSGNSDFFYFSDIVLYEKVSVLLWCLTLCVAPVRILKFQFLRTTCKTVYSTVRKCWGQLVGVSSIICVLTVFQLFVLNSLLCPVSKPLDVETRFHMIRNNDFDYGPYSFILKVISICLAVTSTVANIVLQVLIIYNYKIMSDY